jgi:AhpC/TSA family
MNRSVFRLAAGWLLVAAMAILFAGQQLMAQEKKAAAPPPKLKVGDVAPDFKLQYFDGNDLKDVSLSDYKGKKNVVLAFYIFAFTGG